ncbi:MAG: SGNH/GDSL hydrolase family protein [Thermoanaerobaculia bacterium]
MAGEPAITAAETRPRGALGAGLLLVVQLAGLVALIHLLQLETPAVRQVSRLILAGFAVHLLLPARWRLAGFAALSLVGVGLVLGWRDGAWVLAVGATLIGVCHLPLRLATRAILLAAAGAALALLRSLAGEPGWSTPVSGAAWPIFGSMFMFRLIVYLHDLEHEPVRPRLERSLAYFFMLPNVCFPLFPVVDYKGFRSGYRPSAPATLGQRGLDWMLRGVVHLLIYRLVYNHLLLSPDDVDSFATLVQFLVANILLYVRVSGQFHLIVGMLCLFGFDLPETNRLYFLAASFNDYWRRINIYWREFMLKVVYWPAFLRVKILGRVPAMALAISLVFFASWLLHSYQWFWLQGSFPLRSPDTLFWGSVGLLVLVNSLVESRRRQPRSLAGRSWTAGTGATHALRVLATFSVITVLWSLWTSESIAEWWTLWEGVAVFTRARDLGWLLLVVGAVAALGAAAGWIAGHRPGIRQAVQRPRPAATVISIGVLCLLALNVNRVGPQAGSLLTGMRQTRLSSRDAERLARGYYEGVLTPVRLESELTTRVITQPAEARVDEDRLNFKRRNDLLWIEIRPDRDSTYLGEPFRSNRWGMRDRDYDKHRPADTHRLALLGSSHTMGQGVGNDNTFDAQLEHRLNREGLGDSGAAFEVLNFSVASHSFLQQLVLLEDRILEFEPQVVIYIAHLSETQWNRKHLARLIATGVDLRYPFLKKAVERAGAEKRLGWDRLRRRLRPIQQEVLQWGYRRFVDRCRRRGIVPVWVLMPRLEEFRQHLEAGSLIEIATRAGFETIHLEELYGDRDRRELAVSATDLHFNPEGNRLVADALFDRLRQNAVALGLGGSDDRVEQPAASETIDNAR